MVIYSKVKLGVTPEINALASIIILAVGTCVLIAGWSMKRAERQRELELQMADR
jgi:putrescine transport system permease protein